VHHTDDTRDMAEGSFGGDAFENFGDDVAGDLAGVAGKVAGDTVAHQQEIVGGHC